MTNTSMQHVIDKETSQLYAAVGTLATAGPLLRAGKVRFVAVTDPKRHPASPVDTERPIAQRDRGAPRRAMEPVSSART